MWNQGKNCMGPRIQEVKPATRLGPLCRSVTFNPWQCTFLLANFPNPHQDACAQLGPIILKIYAKFSKSPSGRVCTVMSHNLKNIYPRMLNTMWTLIQTCTLIPTPFTRTCGRWHTAYAGHARWKSYWHTDGQSGLILRQAKASPFTNLLLP